MWTKKCGEQMKKDTCERIQRLEVADHALEMLVNGKLPFVRKLIMGAMFEFRETGNLALHACEPQDDAASAIVNNSQSRGFIKPSLCDNEFKFYVVYLDEELKEHEIALQSQCLGEVVTVTYGLLGLKVELPDITDARLNEDDLKS